MNKALRWTLGGLTVVAGLAVIALVTVLLKNLNDEEVRPEVAKIIEKPENPTEKQWQAHYYFYGIKAGETKEPEAKGRELWQQFEALPKEKREDFFKNEFGKVRQFADGIEFRGCEMGRSVCTRKGIKEEPEVVEIVYANREKLELYLKLLEIGESPAVFFGDQDLPFVTGLRMDIKLSRMLYVLWAEWLNKEDHERVFNSMELVNGYYYDLLKEGTLLDRAVARLLLDSNLRFLIKESEADPKFKARIPQELYDSFRTPDLDTVLYGAMERELQLFVNASHLIGSTSDWRSLVEGYFGTSLKYLTVLRPRFFFKPNQAINHYYEIQMQSLTTDCKEDMEACIPAMEWSHRAGLIRYIDNPVGRVLVLMMSSNLLGQRLKLETKLKEFHQLRESFIP